MSFKCSIGGPKVRRTSKAPRTKVLGAYFLPITSSLLPQKFLGALGSNKNLTKQDEIKDFFVSENLVTRKLVISKK